MYWFIGAVVVLFVVGGIPIAKYVKGLLETASRAGEWQGGTTTLLSGLTSELTGLREDTKEIRDSISNIHTRINDLKDDLHEQDKKIVRIEAGLNGKH